MDVREKLVLLLKGDLPYYSNDVAYWQEQHIGSLADHLIAHGLTVQNLGGCEYCKADFDGFRKVFGAFSLANPFCGKVWQIRAGKCKPIEIYYCPMCGKELNQPPKGE